MKFVLATLMVLSAQAFAQAVSFDGLDGLAQLSAVQKDAVRSSAEVQATAASLNGSIVRIIYTASPDHSALYKVKLSNQCSFYASVNYAANFFKGIQSVTVAPGSARCN